MQETDTRQDEVFLRRAIELAQAAADHGNEPLGAVLVHNGEAVASSENQIYTNRDFTSHAELGLIQRFCRETGVTDLSGYTLYSSCEPCFMCSGAMVWARLGRLVYAASDLELCGLIGVQGSQCSKLVFEHSDWKPQVTAGLLREEGLAVLRSYFAEHEKH